MIKDAIRKLIDKQDLSFDEASSVMKEIMSGRATPAQIAGFLVALRLKGETIEEITAFAQVMREKAYRISPRVPLIVDTCGTGGDNAYTFNISTTAAFVVAGAGIAVAKHGNKSVSSKCGSADVLRALGINIELEPKMVEKCIEEVGIGFMFAPMFHKAMKFAIGPRRELGIRTVFNILGPLTNPANVQAQVVGVFDERLTEPLAQVLGNLNVKHALVVHGSGLDEITVTGKSIISEYKEGKVSSYEISPEDFGMKLCSIHDIKGGNTETNAEILVNILKGENGAKRNIVLLNAAAAIVAADKATNFNEAIDIAAHSIDSGKALEKLEQLREFSNKNVR